MKCKDLIAASGRRLPQGEKSAAVRIIYQNLLYVLDLLAYLLKLALHIYDDASNFCIICFRADGVCLTVKLLH